MDSPITRLERWLDRRPDGEVREGTEPDGWLTKVPSDNTASAKPVFDSTTERVEGE